MTVLFRSCREIPVHIAASFTESAGDSTSDEDTVSRQLLQEMLEEKKVITTAALKDECKIASENDDFSDQSKVVISTSDNSEEQPQMMSSKKNEVELYCDMICRFDCIKPMGDVTPY